MTQDDRTITDRLKTIEAMLVKILSKLDPDPTPPQFSQMLGGQHFAPFVYNGQPIELPLTVGKDGGLTVDRRGG